MRDFLVNSGFEMHNFPITIWDINFSKNKKIARKISNLISDVMVDLDSNSEINENDYLDRISDIIQEYDDSIPNLTTSILKCAILNSIKKVGNKFLSSYELFETNYE